MHPAKAAILTNALAPLWQRLRTWVEAALHNHHNSRDYLTRDELLPIRTSIFEIEALLRRLVLVAATAITLNIQARWSPAPGTNARTRARQTPKRIIRTANTFRLFTIRWSKTDRTLATTVAVETTSDATQAHPHTHTPRTTAHSDSLTSGPSTCRSSKCAGRPASHGRAHIPTDAPEIPIEDVMRWFASCAPAETSGQAAWRQHLEVLAEIERAGQPRRQPQNPTGPRLERKTLPQLLDATQPLARLACLAELAANPDALIQRAAIAMARRREIAYRLSLVAAPKARGALAVSIAMATVIIPFHNDFTEVMLYFAISHTEPDTT